MQSAMRAVMVDHQKIFCEAMFALAATRPGIELMQPANDAATVLAAAAGMRPDLYVIDIVLAGSMNGVALTRELLKRDPDSKILILTALAHTHYATQAMAAGARGFALKEQAWTEVRGAMEVVARGEMYLAPGLPRALLQTRTAERASDIGCGPIDHLTSREREIFDLVIRGHSNHRTASELRISVKTVETHRSKINRKLRVHSTVELVRFAASTGLLWASLGDAPVCAD